MIEHDGTWYYEKQLTSKIWGPFQWGRYVDWSSGGNWGEEFAFFRFGRLGFDWRISESKR